MNCTVHNGRLNHLTSRLTHCYGMASLRRSFHRLCGPCSWNRQIAAAMRLSSAARPSLAEAAQGRVTLCSHRGSSSGPGGQPLPLCRPLNAPCRFGRIDRVPVDCQRLWLRRLHQLKSATTDRGQRFARGPVQFTFKFRLGHSKPFIMGTGPAKHGLGRKDTNARCRPKYRGD